MFQVFLVALSPLQSCRYFPLNDTSQEFPAFERPRLFRQKGSKFRHDHPLSNKED